MRTLAARRVFWWTTWLAAAAGSPIAEPPSAPADEPAHATDPAPATPAPKPVAPKPDFSPTVVAPAIAYPHPSFITEVLFAVPTGADGDANKDGTRQVSGDEFIELVNPHDRAIDLRGYTITDGAAGTKSQVKFTFPAIQVPARGVVLLFNGHESKIPGPLGETKRSPAALNDHFAKSAVFSMRMPSTRASFSNAGDAACLRAPSGQALQRIRWGKADENAGGSAFLLDETAPTTTKGSVQRDGIAKDAIWKVHTELDATVFSPGVFAPFESKTAATPAKPPSNNPEKTTTP